MRVIILGAGIGRRLGKLTKEYPKCLMKIDGITILERTVKILNEYGLKDIIMVIGEQGSCWNQKSIKKIQSIVPTIIVNKENVSTHSGYSCALAMMTIRPQTILVVDGDLVFTRKALETLLSSPPNTLISRPAISPLEAGGKLKLGRKGKILYAGREQPDHLPWDIYSGMMKIHKDTFNILRDTWLQYKDKEILYTINALCSKYNFYVRRVGYEFSSKESGGGSKLKAITIIRKESRNERRLKLANEVQFLLELPEKWKKHFPKVITSKITRRRVFYEMPQYDLPSLRRLLFSGTFDYKDALRWLDKILAFKFTMYPVEKKSVPADYMDFMHIQRIWLRLQETWDKSEVFRNIIPKEELVINGNILKNIPISLSLLERTSSLLEKCLPPYVTRWGHFDLHFANILIDLRNDNFILVDPRGYPFCDYYYDLGKIWHSAHGLYDLISERRFKLRGERKFRYSFWKDSIHEEYGKIACGLPSIFAKYTKESVRDTMMKTEFNEMTHFCSFMPFFFDYDRKEYRALISYLRGALFINKFLEKYLKDYKTISWINVNYPKDWKSVGEVAWRKL